METNKFKNDKELVYRALRNLNRQGEFPSRRELAQYIRNGGEMLMDSSVTGRVSELLDDGHIVETGKKKCAITKQQVTSLAITTVENKHLAEARLKKNEDKVIRTADMHEVPNVDLVCFFEDNSLSESQVKDATSWIKAYIDVSKENGSKISWQKIMNKLNDIRNS